jgi:hypothetical protein
VRLAAVVRRILLLPPLRRVTGPTRRRSISHRRLPGSPLAAGLAHQVIEVVWAADGDQSAELPEFHGTTSRE